MADRKSTHTDASFNSLEGQRFGRWLVLSHICFCRSTNTTYFLCRCDCGTMKPVCGGNLRSGQSESCGCLKHELQQTKKAERQKTGQVVATEFPEYGVWGGMKSRCLSKTNKSYPSYGGRGITICDRWQSSFWAFLDDVGRRPSPLHSLDRIDVNGNYEPGNVRWSTAKQQQNNRRNNRLITFQGETLTLAAWAEKLGISYVTLSIRINRHGEPPEVAFDSEIRHSNIITHAGETMCARDWERKLGFKPATICHRLRRGWSVEEALTTPVVSPQPDSRAS